MRVLTLACIAALAAGSLAIAAGLEDVKHKDTLTVLTSPGYMPFEMKDKKGELIGFDVEVAKRLQKAIGVSRIAWKEVPFEQLFDALAAGDGDVAISGISITEERGKKVSFSEPYAEVGKALMTPAGKALAEGGTVVTAAGTTAEPEVKATYPKATLKTFPDERAAAKEVLEGRADGMLFDAPFLRVWAKRHPGKLDVKDLPALKKEMVGIAVAKSHHDLLAAVNAAIAEMHKDGTLARLEKEFFVDLAWFGSVAGE
jgi:polar amino acid transport system substrate-binding protein